MPDIYEELVADTADWFHQHARHAHPHTTPATSGATITPEPPAQGATMSLASLAADLRTTAETSATSLSRLLDEHLPQIEELGAIVDANPVFASAQAATHVPIEVLEGVASLLDHYAAAYPKPDPAPAAEPQAAA
jgi:hypothetical protein